MTAPVARSAGAVVGCPAFRSSYERNPGMSPPTANRFVAGKSISSAAACAASAKRACATNAFASLSWMM